MSRTLSLLSLQVKPGITGLRLDALAEEFIRDNGGIPSCKEYMGYPSSICLSVNEQAVHCFPTDKPLKEGDVVKIDLTASVDGWNADSAVTLIIPPVKPDVFKLKEITYKAMLEGILAAKDGSRVSDISKAIFNASRANGMSLGVIKEFCGHGIGKNIHESPIIPNHLVKEKDSLIVAGMTICIEPIFCLGKPNVHIQEGQWDTWTLDGSVVSHWEHTILVRENGLFPEILTLRHDETMPF